MSLGSIVELECPNCERRFPVVAVNSRGFCSCGIDFVVDEDRLEVRWTPDKAWPTSGTRTHVTALADGAPA